MPELPEVQNFVFSIEKNYVGKQLKAIAFHRPNLRYPFDQEKLSQIFASGVTLLQCFREGKQLVLATQNGAVTISLGMSGSFKPATVGQPEKHEHVTLSFEDGSAVGYVDARRFGYWLLRAPHYKPRFCDALCENELRDFFAQPKIKQANRSIKDVLMDQQLIGGIGNIYALEALFRARTSPLSPCHTLTAAQWRKLAKIIPALLKEAIEQGGSSISTYRTLHGEQGGFQNLHLVYDRHGQLCPSKNCKGMIERLAQGGRSSWMCPLCQK